ncbi:MAG: mechanosensitive ion channel family protein [Acidimicrobiales bacterium]
MPAVPPLTTAFPVPTFSTASPRPDLLTAEPIAGSGDAEVIDTVGQVIDRSDSTDLLVFVTIFVGALIAGRVARYMVGHLLERGGRTDSLLGDLMGRLFGYVIMAFGTVYALDAIGIAIGPLLGALGVIGIALAFALQSLLENFVAGVLLQVRRPFNRGDEVRAMDFEGQVLGVDSRTLSIRSLDGETVRLPNAEVLKHALVNLSLHGRRRTTVEVGVAYGTDVAEASRVLVAGVTKVDGVLPSPAPVALGVRFGPSGIDLAVRYWHQASIAEEWRVRHLVVVAIAESLAEAGITIPFPQRTVHIDPGPSRPE